LGDFSEISKRARIASEPIIPASLRLFNHTRSSLWDRVQRLLEPTHVPHHALLGSSCSSYFVACISIGLVELETVLIGGLAVASPDRAFAFAILPSMPCSSCRLCACMSCVSQRLKMTAYGPCTERHHSGIFSIVASAPSTRKRTTSVSGNDRVG
jgi:hypothetical protein